MRKIWVVLIGVVLIGSELLAQQRPVISTYHFNPLPLNPAMAGRLNQLSVTAINRNQWVNIDGAPVFQSFTAHNGFKQNQIGGGLIFTRDVVGVHEDIGLYGAYAYKIRMSRGVLSFGLQGGFNSRTSDFTQLNIRDQGDPFLTGTPTTFNPNFGTGVYWQDRRSFVSLSVPFILSPRAFDIETDSPVESEEVRFYYLYAGTIFDLDEHERFRLNPSFLVRVPERGPIGWDLNANLIIDNRVYTGVSWRSGDSIILLLQLILNDNFRVGYGYDIITSSLTRFSAGSHEIMLNYRIPIRNHKNNPECPTYI